MHPVDDRQARRELLDAKLTELALFAKRLCPAARVEASTVQYEDEDGHVDVYLPTGLTEDEEDHIELAIAARAGEVFAETGLFIACAAFEMPAGS